MVRFMLAVVASCSMLALSALWAADKDGEVGLEEFLKAHSKGEAEKYKGFTVKGSAPHFHGLQTITEPGGKPEVFFLLSPFVQMKDGSLRPIRTTKEWTEAQLRGQRLLEISVRGKDLKRHPRAEQILGPVYYFSGKFEGDFETTSPIVRIKGSEPKKDKAPILVESTVTSSPPAAAKPAVKKEPGSQEDDAARRLKFAKSLAADGLNAKARDLYKEIVAKWPKTKAAAEARELLDKAKK